MAYVDDLMRAHVEIKRNWQKIPVNQDIQIPPGEFVHCPLVGQKLIPAAENCPTCPQFHGIGIVMQSRNPKQQAELERTTPWRKRHCICCITIMELKTTSNL